MKARGRVPELYYRSSRICRVLGNPTAYQILKILIKNRKAPSALADELKLSLPTISIALRHLRQIDLVRYENLREGKVYFIKDDTVVSILNQLEVLVKRLSSGDY
jgi:DNA-binding transcriptional ArsR family regulator